MHRMHTLIAKAGVTLFLAAFLAVPASAELIRPRAGSAYPDVASAIGGLQRYTFDPATRTGQFQASITPYLLALGPKVADEFDVRPNPDGVRRQVLNLTLDQNGRLVDVPGNSFALYGTVVVGGQTFQGLLLQGTPTKFGSQGPNAPGGSAFDLNLTITGGALAQTFGQDVYLSLRPSEGATFDGRFNQSFATSVEGGNTIGTHAPERHRAAQPTTIVVLLACGSWLFFHRQFRRIPARGLLPC